MIGITSTALGGGENLNFAVPINDAKKLFGFSSQFQKLFLPFAINRKRPWVDRKNLHRLTSLDPSLAEHRAMDEQIHRSLR